MMKTLLCILFLQLITITDAHPVSGDTIPPEYTWISPKKYAVLTTDAIRLAVSAVDNASGIAKVTFYASYFDYTGRMIERLAVGEVLGPPYEFLWDCSHIPDQSLLVLRLHCDVEDGAENMSRRAVGMDDDSGLNVVLDRNSAFNDKMILSHKVKMKTVIDGDLTEWAPRDSISFSNNDNNIVVYSSWNSKNLFFAFKVDDKSIISSYGPGSETIKGMPQEDLVEVYLDIKHDHAEIREASHVSFLMSAAGMMFKRSIFFDGVRYERFMDVDVDGAVRVIGTLNDESDSDTGYIVELGIRWGDLGLSPGEVESMGLEVWTNDKDYINGDYFYAGWSTVPGSLENPSEWGNIVFTGGRGYLAAALLALFAAVSCSVAVAFFVMRKKKHAETVTPIEDEYIAISKRYIEDHFADENLSREKIAGSVNLSPAYFGRYFTSKTGSSVTDYLTEFRINKAKDLLKSTDKNIAEIAFEIGFSSQSYFGRKFKKHEKISPKLYRNTHRNK